MVDIFKQFVTTLEARNAVKAAESAARTMAEHCDKRIAEKDVLIDAARKALEEVEWISEKPARDICRTAIAKLAEGA